MRERGGNDIRPTYIQATARELEVIFDVCESFLNEQHFTLLVDHETADADGRRGVARQLIGIFLVEPVGQHDVFGDGVMNDEAELLGNRNQFGSIGWYRQPDATTFRLTPGGQRLLELTFEGGRCFSQQLAIDSHTGEDITGTRE